MPALTCAPLSVALATLLLMSTTLTAADAKPDRRDRFEARTFVDADEGKLHYRLLRPKDYDPKQKYPLVLFLHGAGERGDDNSKQLVHAMNDFASDEIMAKYPAFVIAPQCPTGKRWVEVDWSADSHTMPAEPSVPLRQALQIVKDLQKEFSVDADRLYITGLSMGGYGVWDAIQRHPDLFAAAAPVCGGGDPAFAKQIARIPIWAFHGAEDTAVKPKRSREMIAAIEAAGGKPKYTEYPKVGHNSWAPTYSDPALYAWLFAQKKK